MLRNLSAGLLLLLGPACSLACSGGARQEPATKPAPFIYRFPYPIYPTWSAAARALGLPAP